MMTHAKCMNVVIEPIVDYSDHTITARFYGILRPGVGKVNVFLRNHSTKQISLLSWTAVGEIAVANAIPNLLTQNPSEDVSVRGETTTQQG